jgi:hypothetical protein
MKQTPRDPHEEEAETIDLNTDDETLPPGITMDELVALAKVINFPPEDLEEMAAAIQEARRMEAREW